MVLQQNRGVQEGVGGAKVDQRTNGDEHLAWHEELDQEGKVTRGGMGKGDGKGESPAKPLMPTQPSP